MSVLADNTAQNVLRRDHYDCQLRTAVCDRYATHVIPKGDATTDNLQPLGLSQLQSACRPCVEAQSDA